jgi:hypothetical protein
MRYARGMSFRRLPVVVLLVCLFWQAWAHAGGTVMLAADRDVAHAVLHFEGEAHHHHHDGDEGGLHQDDSTTSMSHIVADSGTFAPALWADASTPSFPVPGIVRHGLCIHPLPGPDLQGLERPPKTLL